MKKNFISAIIIASLVAMAPTVFAATKLSKEKGDKKESNVKSDLQLNYLGEENEYVVLQVLLTKADSKNATLRITDGLGEVLHTERFAQGSFSKFIKVSPAELSKIELVLDTINGTQRKLYNLNMSKVSTFKIEEVVIK
jgi:hypothetical protein